MRFHHDADDTGITCCNLLGDIGTNGNLIFVLFRTIRMRGIDHQARRRTASCNILAGRIDAWCIVVRCFAAARNDVAVLIAIPASDATRLGLDYKKGPVGYLQTANGAAPAYRVKLNTVKVGDIELNQVEGVVLEQGLPVILLGMSFLNRTEMRREGENMVLTKRY